MRTDRQSKKLFDVGSHGREQLGAQFRGYRGDRWLLCVGLRVSVDRESARVDAAGGHVDGGNSGSNNGTTRRNVRTYNGLLAGITTGDKNRRFGSGKAGDNSAAHACVIHV